MNAKRSLRGDARLVLWQVFLTLLVFANRNVSWLSWLILGCTLWSAALLGRAWIAQSGPGQN